MTPEVIDAWNWALDSIAKAEEQWTAGRLQDAAELATSALLFACRAIGQLAKELNKPALSETASNLLWEMFQKTDKHRPPKEVMEWARSTLKHLTNHMTGKTVMNDEYKKKLKRFLKDLPRTEKIITVLYYDEEFELTVPEIAEALDMPCSEVSLIHKSILGRCKVYMQQQSHAANKYLGAIYYNS